MKTEIQHLEWLPDLETGDEQIDKEHQSLFALCNNLIKEINGESDDNSLLKIYDELVYYVDSHFMHEERLMIKIDFPALATKAHFANHKEFRDTVEHTERLRSTPSLLGYQMVQITQNWIVDHIMQYDLALALYSKAHYSLDD